MGHDDLVIIGRVAGALVIGAMIGFERTFHGRPAGFRTHSLVCIASAILMIVTVRRPPFLQEARLKLRLKPWFSPLLMSHRARKLFSSRTSASSLLVVSVRSYLLMIGPRSRLMPFPEPGARSTRGFGGGSGSAGCSVEFTVLSCPNQ
jgi:hypothetical protein